MHHPQHLQHLDKQLKTTKTTQSQCPKERTLGPSGCFWAGNHCLPLPHIKRTEDFHALLQNFPLLCRIVYYNRDIQGPARCFESHINQRRRITFISGGWRAGRGARSTRWASCPGTGPQGSLKRFPLFLSRMPKLEAFVLLPFLQVLPSPIKVILAFIKLRIPPPMENLCSEVPLFSVPRCLAHKKKSG